MDVSYTIPYNDLDKMMEDYINLTRIAKSTLCPIRRKDEFGMLISKKEEGPKYYIKITKWKR